MARSEIGREAQMQLILDRYKEPSHLGKLDEANIVHDDANVLCGDHIHMEAVAKDGVLIDARFRGEGCAISYAGADLLIDHVIGMVVSEVQKISKEEMLELVGIPLSPSRIKCAVLSLRVLQDGIEKAEATPSRT